MAGKVDRQAPSAANTEPPIFVDGIGPPLQQIVEDYKDLVRRPYDHEGRSRIGIQAASDVLSLIAEVRRLRGSV
jgi:hypothetical protein